MRSGHYSLNWILNLWELHSRLPRWPLHYWPSTIRSIPVDLSQKSPVRALAMYTGFKGKPRDRGLYSIIWGTGHNYYKGKAVIGTPEIYEDEMTSGTYTTCGTSWPWPSEFRRKKFKFLSPFKNRSMRRKTILSVKSYLKTRTAAAVDSWKQTMGSWGGYPRKTKGFDK